MDRISIATASRWTETARGASQWREATGLRSIGTGATRCLTINTTSSGGVEPIVGGGFVIGLASGMESRPDKPRDGADGADYTSYLLRT